MMKPSTSYPKFLLMKSWMPYLGSTVSRNATLEDEITNRLAEVSTTFGRLRKNVWKRCGIRTDTKVKVYQAVTIYNFFSTNTDSAVHLETLHNHLDTSLRVTLTLVSNMMHVFQKNKRKPVLIEMHIYLLKY